MRRATRNGVLALTASGAMAVTIPAYSAFAADGATAAGNTADVAGIGDPATGNESGKGSGDRPAPPRGPAKPTAPKPTAPKPTAPKPTAPEPSAPEPARPAEEPAPPGHAPHQAPPREVTSELAHTGADQALAAIAGSAALVFGGSALYRRFRPPADT
jgi:hypothetical protein